MNAGSITAMIVTLKNNQKMKGTRTPMGSQERYCKDMKISGNSLKFKKSSPEELEAFKKRFRKSQRKEFLVTLCIMLPFALVLFYCFFWFLGVADWSMFNSIRMLD